MSNQIIPIFNGIINQEEIKLVNAQLLHFFLEVETRFNDWINRRIDDYQFIENSDFILITQKRVTNGRSGDRRSKDYHLTLDMAKEFAMIERTDKGRQARKYFIECEKQLMQILHPLTINEEQKYLISKAIDERVYRTGEKHQTIYHKLYDQFKISSYKELPASKFDEAIKFLGGLLPNKRNYITESNLQCLISHALWIANFWRENQLYKAFKMIGSDFGIRMNDHIDSCYSLSMGLKRELNDIKMIAIK